MSVTGTTSLHTFFDLIKDRLAPVLKTAEAVARNNIYVVDKLRLQNPAVPCIQVEPVSLASIGENSAMNVMSLEYRVHAIVKVEQDFGKGSEQAMLGEGTTTSGAAARGAFTLAVKIADTLIGYKPNPGSECQVFLRLENGGNAELEGLTHASAYFRTMIRLFQDG